MVGYALKAAIFPAHDVFVADMPGRLDIEPGSLLFGGKIYFNPAAGRSGP
jgi:hypothetical protein